MFGRADSVLLYLLFISIRGRAVASVLPSLPEGTVLVATQPSDHAGWELWVGGWGMGWEGVQIGWRGVSKGRKSIGVLVAYLGSFLTHLKFSLL